MYALHTKAAGCQPTYTISYRATNVYRVKWCKAIARVCANFPQSHHTSTHSHTNIRSLTQCCIMLSDTLSNNAKTAKRSNSIEHIITNPNFNFRSIRFDSIQFDSNQLSRIYYYPHIRCISIKSNRLHKCQSVHDLSRNGFALL